jgi:hypothetical protein
MERERIIEELFFCFKKKNKVKRIRTRWSISPSFPSVIVVNTNRLFEAAVFTGATA